MDNDDDDDDDLIDDGALTQAKFLVVGASFSLCRGPPF